MLGQDKDRRSDKKRKDILTAAHARFMAEGYAGTGMEAIARDAMVSTATIYIYFPSKTALFKDIAQTAITHLKSRALDLITQSADGRNPLENCLLAAARFFSDLEARAFLRMMSTERARFSDCALSYADMIDQVFGAAIQELMLDEAGTITLSEPALVSQQILAMVAYPFQTLPLLHGDAHAPALDLNLICAQAYDTFRARLAMTAGAQALRPREVEAA